MRHIAFGDPGQGGYCLLAFERGVLIGANLINATHLAGKLRRAVTGKWDWSKYLEQIDGVLTVPGIERVLSEIADNVHQSYLRLEKGKVAVRSHILNSQSWRHHERNMSAI